MKEFIKIASGQGFWGDLIDAPVKQASQGQIDYLMMDYLAEVTMSILQKQKLKDPSLGYARDIPVLMERLLPLLKEKHFKIVTNGGGVNPLSCRDAVFDAARKIGIKDLKIGVVMGDDILTRINEMDVASVPRTDTDLGVGSSLNNMDTGESAETIKDKILSANVYFGAFPVADALRQGADIVITGRVTDTGLTLAPMIYEFNWAEDDWDKLAAGTVAGHIIECGGQASGGNFHGNWEKIPDLAHIGFPIVESYPDGNIFITKHPGTGGLVSIETVSEQLVYEIGNPKEYITPDCIADFTSIHLEETEKNRVRVHGVKGLPATDSYKVSMSYHDGYSAVSTLTYSAPDALRRAEAADKILRTRLADLKLQFDEIRTEYVGYNSCHGPLSKKMICEERSDEAIPHSKKKISLPEVVLRIGVRSKDKSAVERFGKEIAPLILTGPPGVTGFSGGRPKPSDVVAYWPCLIPKSLVKPKVIVEGI